MAKQDLLDGLHEAIRTAEQGWEARPIAELPTIDTVLKTSRFAAFFRLVDAPGDLESIHQAAQSQISSIYWESIVAARPCARPTRRRSDATRPGLDP